MVVSMAAEEGKKLKKSDKVYAVCMNKTAVLFNIGSEPITDGMNIAYPAHRQTFLIYDILVDEVNRNFFDFSFSCRIYLPYDIYP